MVHNTQSIQLEIITEYREEDRTFVLMVLPYQLS